MNDGVRLKKQKERFNQRHTKSNYGCWEWNWKKDKDGYGRFHARPITQRAHRFSYFIHSGHLPKDKLICHSCDNPSCVNPEHLWIGTVKDNNEDARKKGRIIPPYLNKIFCIRGHRFTKENTYVPKSGKTKRICRECNRIRNRLTKKKIRQKRKAVARGLF